ncbi:hypothetical protein GJ496_011242 [Pomphorhynchus laevis]|nr:hypothetical protein GJ496_011242 [Pomphorhynchus laevis]
MDIIGAITRLPALIFGVERHDDDFTDRLSYKYTVAILVVFAIIVTNRQFGTKQIQCWVPAQFTRNYEEYVNDICWVSNTYYIPVDQKLPKDNTERRRHEIRYYQWVPFILMLQAFTFYLPHMTWRTLSRRSGIDLKNLVEAASSYKSVEKFEKRNILMKYLVATIDQYVDDPRRQTDSRNMSQCTRFVSVINCISGRFLGNYLIILYFFVKLMFALNTVVEFFILGQLLGQKFQMFGIEVIERMLAGKGWDSSNKYFPKVTLCDLKVREPGHPQVSHQYTVQCVLPINLFNQQIFTFIWFWYMLVLVATLYDIGVWVFRFIPSKRFNYIERRLRLMSFDNWKSQINNIEYKNFVYSYLESDGVFMLRVIANNTSDFVCTEIIQQLWLKYQYQHNLMKTKQTDISQGTHA